MINNGPQVETVQVRSDWLQSYHVPHGNLDEFHDNSQKLRIFFIQINVKTSELLTIF